MDTYAIDLFYSSTPCKEWSQANWRGEGPAANTGGLAVAAVNVSEG